LGINIEIFQKITKNRKMKKFLAIIAIASIAVACNNEGDKKATTDSTTNVIDSTVNAAKDSIGSVVDSATKVIDSTAKAAMDTVKSKM
jgi:hypothetical protein